MALAKKCDRCKNLYEHYPIGDQKGHFNAVARIRTSDSGVKYYEESFKDLCPDCMSLLNEFIRGYELSEKAEEK